MFVVVETVFDRLNTSLKSFIFCVQSGGTAGDCILFKFMKTNFCQFVFVVVETVFDRSNTSLKSFNFVCSQDGRRLYFHFTLKTNLFVDEVCVRCD